MGAYEDGYSSNLSTPPTSISKQDYYEWKRGHEAAEKHMEMLFPSSNKPASPEVAGAGIVAILLVVVVTFIIVGCAMFLDWVKHLIWAVPSGVWMLIGAIFCTTVVYFLAREIKQMGRE